MQTPIYNSYNNFKIKYWENYEKIKNKETLLSYTNTLLKDYKNFELKFHQKTIDEEVIKFIIDGTPIIYESINGEIIFDYDNKVLFDFYKFLTKQEIHKIIDFLKTKIEDEKSNLLRFQGITQPQPIELPENDFSNNSDKEKIIILEKLGIIDFVKSLQTEPLTIAHTAEIISAFTGIKSKTLNTYISPMLQSYRDDDHPNSPYKNKNNLLNANRTIQKLKLKDIDASQ